MQGKSKGKKLRLFIAVDIPDELRQALKRFQEKHDARLSGRIPQFRWMEPDSWHVTLLFLGAVDEDWLPWLKRTIQDTAQQFTPFRLQYDFTGYAPPGPRARMIWVYYREHSDWQALAFAMYYALRRRLSSLEKPRVPVIPHITLARFAWMPVSKLPTLDALGYREPLEVRQVELWSSELRPTGARYSRLMTFPLAG